MRSFFILLFSLLSTVASGQRYFSIAIVEENTETPTGKLICTILKDHDQFVNFGSSDENGIYTFYIADYDSTATYQVEILNRWQNHVKSVRHDISAIKHSIPVVKVTPVGTVARYACSIISYGNYKPKEPYTFEELPVEIRKKVKRHLVNRVGRGFYTNLHLNGGQIVDLDRYYALNPDDRVKGYLPHTYLLCFMVLDPHDGGLRYSFNLALDGNGELTREIPLPNIRRHPHKATILTLDQAKSIAEKSTQDQRFTRHELVYAPSLKALVWEFGHIANEPAGATQLTTLLLDAHTGSILGTRTEEILIVE